MSFGLTDFTFNNTIPAADNDPSVDQPGMLTNNQSTQSILEVDHVTFGDAGGGTHKWNTFLSNNVPISSPSGQQAVAYTNVGVADTASQYFFQNPSAIYMLNAVKAFGNFTLTSVVGSVSANNQYNVASINKVSANVYTITLVADVVKSEHPIFILFVPGSTIAAPAFSYTFTNPTFQINGVSADGFSQCNFVVLEA